MFDGLTDLLCPLDGASDFHLFLGLADSGPLARFASTRTGGVVERRPATKGLASTAFSPPSLAGKLRAGKPSGGVASARASSGSRRAVSE